MKKCLQKTGVVCFVIKNQQIMIFKTTKKILEMKILLNTDYNISGSEEMRETLKDVIKMLSIGSVNILLV
jgi:hypothetical protein